MRACQRAKCRNSATNGCATIVILQAIVPANTVLATSPLLKLTPLVCIDVGIAMLPWPQFVRIHACEAEALPAVRLRRDAATICYSGLCGSHCGCCACGRVRAAYIHLPTPLAGVFVDRPTFGCLPRLTEEPDKYCREDNASSYLMGALVLRWQLPAPKAWEAASLAS